MCACDICLAPKHGLKSGYSSLKLFEYMACGRPVVASRASGHEAVEESQCGILVDPSNTAEMAAAIISLLQDDELRKEMGKKGRYYIEENLNWVSVAKRVAAVCQEVI